MIVLFSSNQIIISNIVTKQNYNFDFDENGGKFIENRVYVTGITNKNEIVEIDKSEILSYVMVAKTNAGASVAASLGVLVGIFVGLSLLSPQQNNHVRLFIV